MSVYERAHATLARVRGWVDASTCVIYACIVCINVVMLTYDDLCMAGMDAVTVV